jgi:two-component system, sensor histidine kinase
VKNKNTLSKHKLGVDRKSIARMLHDQVGQLLIALKIDLSLLIRKNSLATTPLPQEELDWDLKALAKLLDESIDSVKNMASDLRASQIDLDLQIEIEKVVAELRVKTGIEVKVLLPPVLPELPPEMTGEVICIIKESFQNIRRHSQASLVIFSVKEEFDSLIFCIQDNGIGIDPVAVFSDQSLGILGMQERAQNIGATLKVVPLPEHGTLVELRLSPANTRFQ